MITKVLWLWKKAKATNSKQTKHIRFSIFINDKIVQNEPELKYYPIDEMWSYIQTKPFQVSKFRETWAK